MLADSEHSTLRQVSSIETEAVKVGKLRKEASLDQDILSMRNSFITNTKSSLETEGQPKDIMSIPIKCQIKSHHENIFDKILQMDNYSQKTLIDSLDVQFNND